MVINKNIIIQDQQKAPPGKSITVLYCMFLSLFLLSGCNSASLDQFVRGPDLDKVGAMEREPITRLAFAPVQYEDETIRPMIEYTAQEASAIETASGEESKN